MEYYAVCYEHRVALEGGCCPKCARANGERFQAPMQDYFLVPVGESIEPESEDPKEKKT